MAAAYAALSERARVESFGFEEEVAVVDVETTGWNAERDALIEVAGAIMRGPEIVDRFSTLVDPGRAIPLEISRLTGIDDSMVAGGPCPQRAACDLADFIGGRDIVAHNGSFDRAFLSRAAGEQAFARSAWIDSLQVVRIALPRLRSHRLTDLAVAFGVQQDNEHRAADDVEALAFIWRVARAGLSNLPPGLLSRIAALAPEAPWALRQTIAQHAAAYTSVPWDLRDTRRERVSVDRAEALEDAEDVGCATPPAESVVAEFEEAGLAGRMYDGFERRDEQLRMARAVVEAFGSRKFGAIEAGTGVGKSMAYLVPSALFAQRNGIGVGVATKTNALMDQLVYHELPRLCEALEGELRFVALKGYDHYVCLRKLERHASELGADADEDRIATVAALLAWAAQSPWGDLDQINLHWRRDLRSAVSASQADCNRKRCRFFPQLCYLHGVRRRAQSAHVVVTNHALLFRDVVAQGAVLPPLRHWIVDEAHAAESEARKQLTLGTTHADLSAVLSAFSSKRGSTLENLRQGLRRQEDAAPLLAAISRMQDDAARATTLADSMFDFIKDLAEHAEQSAYDTVDLRVSQRIRETGTWGSVDATGRSLAKRLAALIAEGRELVTLLEEHGVALQDVRADLAGSLSRLAEHYVGLVAVLDGEDEGLVYAARLDRRRTVAGEKLAAARLDVGEVLAEEFYPRMHSAVFTSATIATGESFEHFERVVGLDRMPEERTFALRLPSSYDFERQMAVFVPTDVPEPRSRDYVDALERLLFDVHTAMGGSVLTLFTNRRELEELFGRLEPRLREEGLLLIRQHKGTSAKRLRDEFIADERMSLFALRSFWEGFDAKGDTLRCVIVPKLPFGRPTDPLSQEREEREGRNAWSRYSLPEAVIDLKQAAGRLIRSSTDMGCLVIADTRIVAKGYGQRFIEALPVADVERMESERVVEEISRRFGRP
ncbi:MAG: DNA polymerase III subunit epsilon [Coriobacteriales bacterium]|nr:DNA polymerase III subunit epsilon [Coriobacteriales bacterium]